MKKILSIASMLLCTCMVVWAQDTQWPREIPLAKTGGKIVIYQPQPDELTGNKLTGKAAIAGKEKSADELTFGAIFFEATLFTDKANRTATLESVKINTVKIAGVEDTAKLNKLVALLETEIPKWQLTISLDQLVAAIKKEHPDAEIYNNEPPKIIVKNKPTTLVLLDGEPRIQKDKNLDADRVANSPYLIFKEGSQWNMYLGGVWYKSMAVTTGWVAATGMSKKVKSINDQIKKQEKENNDNKPVTDKPQVTDIIVSTEPAELIQTKGEPEFKKIDSTSLQYVANSNNDILKTPDGQIYILIAGRWFKSASLNGPWVFNEPDKLPADFSKIPEGSEKDNVLVSVSGTDAAEEAIIDAEIPQTAKIDRKTAKITVNYDGEPSFEAIEGCNLQLAVNANLTVLKEAGGDCYALDNGVWYISTNAKGPWVVADKRPAEVDKIPARSAAYNSKFVHIYEATSDYVIAGYTAGYLGSYIQGDPVIVFGTGFYYRPWFGSIYYPRPCTWGFGFSYNPWFGWSMSYGFNIGFLHIGFGWGGGWGGWGWGGGGWFGPPMYRPPYRPPYHGGYYGHHRPRPYNNRPGGNFNNNHNNLYRPGRGPGVARPGITNRPGNNIGGGNSFRPDKTRPAVNPGNNNKRPTRPSG
ncbi:MAG: hypothetical protein RL172_1457, partial [Bacteroidota bacterium]